MKIQVKIPGAELYGFFVLYMFAGEEAVHFYSANQALIKMIEGAYIKAVKLRVHIAYSGQVYTGSMLCSGKHGWKQQAGYKKPL